MWYNKAESEVVGLFTKNGGGWRTADGGRRTADHQEGVFYSYNEDFLQPCTLKPQSEPVSPFRCLSSLRPLRLCGEKVRVTIAGWMLALRENIAMVQWHT
jgi:hypothetical protein